MDFSDLDGHIHNVVNTRRPERSSSLCANPKTSEFFIFYYYYYYYSFSSDEKTQTFIVIGTQIGATNKLINQSPPSSIYGVLHRERSSLVRQMVCKSMRKQSNLILSAWNLITSLSNRHEKFLRVFPSFFFLLYFTLLYVLCIIQRWWQHRKGEQWKVFEVDTARDGSFVHSQSLWNVLFFFYYFLSFLCFFLCVCVCVCVCHEN